MVNKIELIKDIRAISNLGLKGSKEIADMLISKGWLLQVAIDDETYYRLKDMKLIANGAYNAKMSITDALKAVSLLCDSLLRKAERREK